jgi:putative sterol carrier protein
MSAESYVYLRKLTTQDGEPIEDILQRGAEQLHGLVEKGILQFRLTDTRSTYSILLTSSGAFVHTEHVTKPTLVVITTSDAFFDIAKGSYSPVQAYLDGKVRILGDVDLGRRVILHLAGSGTQVAPCLTAREEAPIPAAPIVTPWLATESWKLDGPGFGSLTLTGRFFTPFGTVEIEYDWGGGFYRQIADADSSGSFTVTETLYCGDIPGRPGVGVVVTAIDLASGKSTTQAYPTPC